MSALFYKESGQISNLVVFTFQALPLPANIRVAVRVRPENAAEEANGAHRNVVEIVDERMLVFDPKQVNKISSSLPRTKNDFELCRCIT